MTTENQQDFVKIYTLPSEIYGEMVKEALETDGIQCVLKSEMMGSALGVKGISVNNEDCHVFVQHKDKEKAEEILHKMMDHI